MRFFTWEITLSTKGDVCPIVCDNIVAYLKKKCRFGYVIIEEAAKKHLHAAVCFKDAMEKKHFEETIWKKVEKQHPDSKKSVALKSTVQSDHEWRDLYLQKTDKAKVLWDEYDHKEYSKFFPTEEEQEALKAAAAAKLPLAKDFADPKFAALERDWDEYSTEVTYESAVKFLLYQMNVARKMHVIVDQRKLSQTAYALYMYRAHIIEPQVEHIRYGKLMTGELSTFGS